MAFNLSSSNRTQLVAKLEGVYPTNWGVAQGGNGFNLNMTGESLDAAIRYLESSTIRADRQTPSAIPVSASPGGGFNFELQYKEYDPFLQAVMQNDFVHYGTNGVSAAIATLTLTSTTITAGVAPTGGDAFTTLQRGQWFTVRPAAGASAPVKAYFATRAFRVHPTTPPTTTAITLDPATPINTTLGGVSLSGATLVSSRAENGSTVKSYTFEVQHQDNARNRHYRGMIASKIDLKLSVAGMITGSFEFMGSTSAMDTVTEMGSPTASQTTTPMNATQGVFDILVGGVSVSTNTYIKSAEITIDNQIRAQDAVGNFGNVGLASGSISAKGKLEVYFADEVMYNQFATGASSSVTIPMMDVEGNGYVVYFPQIKYTAGKVNAGGQNQDNVLSMEFMAILDPVATSPTYNKTMLLYRV